ncbi:cell surface protein SprA [Parabacteroides sp. HGS0025]|uniref:T9SS outer membrane translocon Sov/SprA n=1 Tax=Parabacteroides sp. HGS0025 TaxID=1078087 RepID=UPI0006171AD6|nr:cell surface protein SprA [Parabacteroides sp. HGS0025]KKB46323.1 cell surface protein SprA [Parabacteroides sp. HGS0025]
MKKKTLKYLIWVTILLFGVGMLSLNADYLTYTATLPDIQLLDGQDMPDGKDTVPATRYPVSKTIPQDYEDLTKKSPMDLRDPENVKTAVEYDLKTGSYVVRTRLGDKDLTTPISLTPEEYQDYSMQQSLRSYYRQKNEEEFQKEADKKFNLADMQFGIGAAERVFGPGGVRVKTQGSAEVTMGLKRNSTQDPSLPERARSRTFFNFDESVQLNVQASVGSKVNFDMNYNTETSFDFDSKKLKLAYTGEEDEIIKSLEAGNVSMTTSNSLINGGAALFGMKADLQFGKLRVNALFAQQESESKTVNSKGGVQTKPFELTIDKYDENRHFFMAHYFYHNYDNAVAKLPQINAPLTITRMQVWVTNTRGNYDQARNIVAFTDLAENNKEYIYNNQFTVVGMPQYPANDANTLYSQLQGRYSGARDITQAQQVLSDLVGGVDYEEVESARLLDASEYTYDKQLGYISLKTTLQPGDVLAVAYEYEYSDGGTKKTKRVGEFSDDSNITPSQAIFVKLLKNTNMTPSMKFWKLMMKNVYSLGAYSVQKEKFRLDVTYQSDTTGTYLNYLPESTNPKQIWIRIMGADRLNSQNQEHSDGFFDFVEGYTIQTETGKVIFPSVEPFGSSLKKKMTDLNISAAIADKYVFQELYDSTQTVARQIAEKNKFKMTGEYKASSAAEIQLGASNVARGSVRVTAAGAVLTENVDYTVDYTSGTVTILNESIISAGTPVSVTLENQTAYSMQRKTMVGLDLNYQFNPNFSLGATIMHMSEMPLTTKTTIGDESIKNTLWGLNTSYKAESQWLTNMFDKLPLLTLTQPSQIAFNAEFAHLIAGHYESKENGGYSYIDDFEATQSGYDLLSPYPWKLASTPADDNKATALFPNADKVDDIAYGKERALLAWYYVDGLFTRRNSSQRPSYMTKNDLSNHYVREIQVSELFPDKDMGYNETSTINALNLAFYPNERGPYNLDADQVNPDGTLQNPEKRWGGIMRKIDQSDFETANVEYIEFWMLDPFLEDSNKINTGGDLYFNLGEISEDVLKDGRKFFENGLPIDGDQTKVDSTVWGLVPKQQSTVYAFDNTAGTRDRQDVGLNGLSAEQEREYPTYKEFIEKLKTKLAPATITDMEGDLFSPLNNPGTDKYRYFRGADLDSKELSILERYKRYNGTEGNSAETGRNGERYDTSASKNPDVEDLNQDNTMNKNEKYFEYKITISPNGLKVGENYIVDEKPARPTLANGKKDSVTWYLFKIPIKKYNRRVGAINDFKSIRFMRMYMTNFKQPTILRFGSFELVRGDWRSYEQDLSDPKVPVQSNGTLEVSSVNIEENSTRTPIHYVTPEGVSREIMTGQPQYVRQNEQSLSLKVTELSPFDARAVYKNTSYDLRQYKRIEMFTHAEALVNDSNVPTDGDMSVFIRLGSDYKNNYYEYEVPLTLTAHSTTASNKEIWPDANKISFAFEILTDLKLERNSDKRKGVSGVNFQTVYSKPDPNNGLNTRKIVGNPSLAEVKTIMIGVRNKSNTVKSAEVWVNELRLSDFNESGGWAANANLNVAVSDLGTVNVGGRIETAGFGALDQSLSERRIDDFSQYNIATNIEWGKFFPEKAKVSIPMYYAYSKEMTKPQYNPLDQDIKLKDALDAVETKAEKDSIKNFSVDKTVIKSISFNNVKADIRSKNPMPYDPANFSFGYSFSQSKKQNPETEYETTKDYRGNLAYSYTPYVKPFRPFQKLKKSNGYTRYIKQFSLNYVPSNISFQTAMMRNYYELQLRDLEDTGYKPEASFSSTFYWDRAFSLRWDFTNNLNMTFTSGTNARIEEPYQQVNKELNPNGYEIWKDSVKQSIADLGTPMKYDQTFNVTWNLPLQYIPVLDWVNSSLTYNAQYNWDRGAEVESTYEIGNTIKNNRQIDMQNSLNMLSLYNKNKFLKKVNQKFSATRTSAKKKEQKEIKLEKDIQLNMDSGTVVQHGMFTKKVRITARGADGKVYAIKYKPINYAQVMILNKDTAHLKLTIKPGPKATEDFLYKTAEHASRFLMMVRRINIQYQTTDGMMIPGFRPMIGDIFGQGRSAGVLSPGLGFAFGAVNRSYIDDAKERGWLVDDNPNNITPAVISSAKNLNIRANLEPITGLKIDLNANRVDTRSTEIQYAYNNMTEQTGGNFLMTTIGLKGFFKGSGNADNGYASDVFNKFIENREIIANRLENRYSGTTYPNKGFLTENGQGGEEYKGGGVNKNSADVLIPAFLAAYTGKDPNKISSSPFPALRNLLPNWRITYDGLVRIPIIKQHFKSVMLSHQYVCTYNVGSYNSYSTWVDGGLGDNLGFTQGSNNLAIPSSPYEISSVSLNESFNPLLGVDATMLNNITIRMDYSTSRNLNLNISSYQIVEALSNKYTIGLGYKFAEFNKILKMKKTRDFSNDLTVRLDFSYNKMQSLIRKIEDSFTQATSGNIAKTIQFSADYGLSRALTLRAFYDLQINEPLISNASYPTSNSNYGVALRFSLAQ